MTAQTRRLSPPRRPMRQRASPTVLKGYTRTVRITQQNGRNFDAQRSETSSSRNNMSRTHSSSNRTSLRSNTNRSASRQSSQGASRGPARGPASVRGRRPNMAERRLFRSSGSRGPCRPLGLPLQENGKPKAISKPRKGILRMYPLGGNEEVGRNSTVFELDDDIIILDMGLMFPEEDMPGVDYIIPSIESLRGKVKNIRAVVLTHGHLDHIGALPYTLPKLGNPTVVGSDMTLALVKKRNDEFKSNPPLNTITVKHEGETLSFGRFKITFFTVAHSVREAFGVVIQTPKINIIHMGDWRYDLDPVEGKPTNFRHLAKWNTRKVPSLIAFESLGATREGRQGSERDAYEATKKIIQEAPGRVIFGTFSSMLERVGQIIELAEKAGRKVAIDGYSMKASVEIGKQFGYIKAKSGTFIDIRQVNKYPPKRVCIVATGSQADERSVLVRVANHEHRHIEVQPDDTIVFSSSVIPGNERVIQRLKDNLYRQGANVIHKEIVDAIHGGGHAKRDDIRLLLSQVKPKYIMPVFANHYMLKECEKLVIGEGWKPSEIFVIDNGQIVEFEAKGPKVLDEKVNTDYIFVDGLGVGDVSNIVIRDRQMLSDDGMVVIIATVRSRTGRLVQNPDIISRGFVHLKENREFVEALRRKARKIVMDHYDPRTSAQDFYIKNKLRTEIGQFIMQKTQRRPMVLPVVIEV